MLFVCACCMRMLRARVACVCMCGVFCCVARVACLCGEFGWGRGTYLVVPPSSLPPSSSLDKRAM